MGSEVMSLTIKSLIITQTTSRKWWPLVLLFVLLSCGNSNRGGSISRGPVDSAVGQPITSGNFGNPALSGDTSGSKSNATTPTGLPSGSKDADQANTTFPPTIPSAPSTFAPRFLSFNCSVVVRDYVGSAPQNGQALEILVQTQGPTAGVVWAEATSKNFRKRVALKLDTKGVGRTVFVAPEEYAVQVKIFAASTFEPSSLMCQASN
jgi:hypothetical protein